MKTTKRAEAEGARLRLWRVQVQELPDLDLMVLARSEDAAEEIALTYTEHALEDVDVAGEVRAGGAVPFRAPRSPQEGVDSGA